MSENSIVEVRVEFEAKDVELAILAISEFSPGGFVEEELDDGSTRFCVFLPVGSETRFTSWLAQEKLTPRTEPMMAIVPPGWNERWKEFHKPVTIGGLWVGPPWSLDEAPTTLRHVVIEPAQGFGTGAHPTTRLVLSLLQKQAKSSILDIGCGSGVLAIAAAKMGFAPITAIDNDEAAIDSTKDNAKRNNVESLIRIQRLDVLQQQIPKADLVLANILLEPLVRIAKQMTAPRLILSGLLRSQVEECVVAYEEAGYVLRERSDRDGWAALVMDNTDEYSNTMINKPLW